MKKALKKEPNLYHIIGGVMVVGPNPELRGDCSGLVGDCSGLRGDCSMLRGNCTGLSGDLDECDITKQDRIEGVDISTLVQGDE